ncbi:MAG: dihydrodipicolinate synthase family protein [Pseudomonadota bacterium]|nr:dihydrodipicolinate synthase family protein [Pseudomonadota bacterium]
MSRYAELRDRIQGPVYSVVSPFTEDERIDFDALRAYLERVYASGGRIFYVMAYNSRYSELSWEEIRALNEFVVRTVKAFGDDVIAVVADPLHCSTAVSMDFCRHAEAIGADLISLIFREKFYSEAQVVRHFEMCAGAADVGVLIHEMPFISGLGGHTVNWPVSLLDRIADIENVIAIKEDAKEDAYSHEVIACLRDRLAIVISGGGKRQWLRFAEHGCQAWLNGIGVFEPRLPPLFWQAYKAGDTALLERIIEEIEVPFFEDIVGPFGWHLGIRGALEARGIFARHERMPMMPIPEADMPKVRATMDRIEAALEGILAGT